jgi:hypothetical protein
MASPPQLTNAHVIPGFYGPGSTLAMPSERDFVGRILNHQTFAEARYAVESLRRAASQLREPECDYVKQLLYNAEQIRKLINACRDSRFQL